MVMDGGPDTHDRLIREPANEARAAIVFVNYTPSPEAKYPVSMEQCSYKMGRRKWPKRKC